MAESIIDWFVVREKYCSFVEKVRLISQVNRTIRARSCSMRKSLALALCSSVPMQGGFNKDSTGTHLDPVRLSGEKFNWNRYLNLYKQVNLEWFLVLEPAKASFVCLGSVPGPKTFQAWIRWIQVCHSFQARIHNQELIVTELVQLPFVSAKNDYRVPFLFSCPLRPLPLQAVAVFLPYRLKAVLWL